MKALLLDRDGVINWERPDHVRRWSEFEFRPGALAALAALRRHGFLAIVVTNQAAVGRGLMTASALDGLHQRMAQMIQAGGGFLAAIYSCPHPPEAGCVCRKPRPGLLRRASRDFDLDLRHCWLVGDRLRDIDAAAAVGCRALLTVGEGAVDGRVVSAVRADGPAVMVADLAAAVDHILTQEEV